MNSMLILINYLYFDKYMIITAVHIVEIQHFLNIIHMFTV